MHRAHRRPARFVLHDAAAMQVTTVEGLERDGKLHPLQAAFIEHDGFQCGFCTSGQIMSAVAMIEEAKSGWPSAATADVTRNTAFFPGVPCCPENVVP